MTLLDIAERKVSRVELLADYFTARPNVWIDGRDLEFAGRYAWRTRVSDCRLKLHMRIEQRERWCGDMAGRKWKVSEYRFVPAGTSEAR